MLNEQPKLLEVEKAQTNNGTMVAPTQSANSLFRFFTKSEYLFESIKKTALFPRYYPETVSYLDINMYHIAYPMICFCDINLHKMDEHISLYGGYGLAFSKSWGIEKAIQPVHYVNPDSPLCKDFSIAFKESVEDGANCAAQNYLLSQMYYLKPLYGTMQRDGSEISRNFTDEREWRYIPSVSNENLPQAVTQEDMFSLSILNDTIAFKETCWLKFSLEDVKYIILQTNYEFKELCNLLDESNISPLTKKKLISKVIIWEESRGDF